MTAVILYIFILLMAATVAGLTIVYFIKPGASRSRGMSGTKRDKRAESNPSAQDSMSVQSGAPISITDDKPIGNVSQVGTKLPPEIKRESPKAEPISNNTDKASKPNIIIQPKQVEKPVRKQESIKETSKVQTPVPQGQKSLPSVAAKTADNKNIKPPVKPETDKPKATPEKANLVVAEVKPEVDKKTPEPISSLGDLSKMFSKEIVEDTEATKLARDLKDVDIGNLIEDSKNLIALLKNNRS
ncbi:MAG: hypothetical protein JW967_11670 [Dehalococcoidales bacterium]|nr:hypothetical protein [Dehalococcoidales bacterium]